MRKQVPYQGEEDAQESEGKNNISKISTLLRFQLDPDPGSTKRTELAPAYTVDQTYAFAGLNCL